jgi:hypothetical protein
MGSVYLCFRPVFETTAGRIAAKRGDDATDERCQPTVKRETHGTLDVWEHVAGEALSLRRSTEQ